MLKYGWSLFIINFVWWKAICENTIKTNLTEITSHTVFICFAIVCACISTYFNFRHGFLLSKLYLQLIIGNRDVTSTFTRTTEDNGARCTITLTRLNYIGDVDNGRTIQTVAVTSNGNVSDFEFCRGWVNRECDKIFKFINGISFFQMACFWNLRLYCIIHNTEN